MEKWRVEARKVSSELYDKSYETLEDALWTAKNILEMYNESENSFYESLHCESYRDENRNKQVRSNARKEITQLKNFIKKYSK